MRVEISAERLAELLAQDVLCMADSHCLDTAFKAQIHRLCMKYCAQSLCVSTLNSAFQTIRPHFRLIVILVKRLYLSRLEILAEYAYPTLK